jgi:hypothetical protein
MTGEDLLANYGHQWRADIENEPSTARLAPLSADDMDDMNAVRQA